MALNPYQADAVLSQDDARSNLRPASIWKGAAGCLILVLLVLVPIVVAAAFLLGALLGESGQYHRRALEQAEQMQQVQKLHPDRFGRLTIEEASNGWSYFEGTVKSVEDLDLLRSEMQRLFGEELADRMTTLVEVSPPTRMSPEDRGRSSAGSATSASQ